MENQTMTPSPLQPAETTQTPGPGALPPIGQLFSESWALMKKRFWVIFLSYLMPVLAIMGAGALGVLLWFVANRINSMAGIIVGAILVIGFIVFYVYMLFLIAASPWVALRDAEENTGWVENLKRAKPIIWSMFLVSLLVQLVVMGGFALLIVPGMILAVRYGFAPLIMAVEGKKGRAALAQSKVYVIGRSWKVFWRFFLLQLSFFVAVFVIQLIAGFAHNAILSLVLVVVTWVLEIIFIVYLFAFQFTLYKHLKNTAQPQPYEKYMGAVTGWAVWGVVGFILIFVVGFMTSVALLALNSARAKSRDALRLAQVRQLDSGLELYYTDNGKYPESLNMLTPKYIHEATVPPTPKDGTCTDAENQYQYSTQPDGQDFVLTFCLGGETGGLTPGLHSVSYKDGMK